MKKLYEAMAKNKWTLLVFYILACMVASLVLFPVLEYVYSLVTGNPFVPDFKHWLLGAGRNGFVVGLVLFVLGPAKKKN